MEPEGPPVGSVGVSGQRAEPATWELPLTQQDRSPESAGRFRRKAPWVIALVVVLIATGAAVAFTKPFGSAGVSAPGVAESAGPTGIYTVARQNLSSQTQLSATLGYDGSYSIPVPSGTSMEDVTQAQETVTQDQQTLSADEQTASDASSAADQAIAADQTDVAIGQSTLSADQASEYQDCAGSGASDRGVHSGRPEGQHGPVRPVPGRPATVHRSVECQPRPRPEPGEGPVRPDQAG